MDAFFRGDLSEDEFRKQQREHYGRIRSEPDAISEAILAVIRRDLTVEGE
jgi:hypothetical protein